MSPRSSAAEAARNRERIVHAVVDHASTSGFTHVSAREVARDLALSKSGVLGPFASRDDLLSEALEAALSAFVAAVLTPSLDRPPGAPRLAAIADLWVDYLVDCPFPGGCIVTSASIDLDSRPGPLREHLVREVERWRGFLAEQFRSAGRSERDALDATSLLNGIAMVANQEIQLLRDPTAGARARRAMRAVLAG